MNTAVLASNRAPYVGGSVTGLAEALSDALGCTFAGAGAVLRPDLSRSKRRGEEQRQDDGNEGDQPGEALHGLLLAAPKMEGGAIEVNVDCVGT